MVEDHKITAVSYVLTGDRETSMTPVTSRATSAAERIAEQMACELVAYQKAEIIRLREKTLSMKAKMGTQKEKIFVLKAQIKDSKIPKP